MLFFEPRLSKSGIISCNTCHNVGLAGIDGVQTSIGHGFQKGPRNAPTTHNAVFNITQFWDSRAPDLKTQAKGPVQASVEMNNTTEQVEKTLRSIPEYVQAFQKAFPNDQEPVSFDHMAQAIEVFEATLITPHSRFDQYLTGKTSLTSEETRGLKLFIEKGCVACHSGVNLGGNSDQKFGVVSKPSPAVLPPSDKGRMAVTKSATDEHVFRVAPLRNIALTAPYFHSGAVWGLEEAVNIMASAQLGQTLKPEETKDLVAFLQTLTGEQPKVQYPLLPPSTATTPRPSAN